MSELVNKKNYKKILAISAAIFLLIVVYVFLAKACGVGPEMLFLGIIVWAKCYNKSLKPLDILKVWTGGAVGVLIYLCKYYTGMAFGETAGVIALLVAIFVQLVFEVGHINPWIVNPATPFFMTLSIGLSEFLSAEQIIKNFVIAFLLAGVPFIIVGLVLKKKKSS